MKKINLDKRLLYDLYIAQKVSAEQIGEKLNCDKSTVLHYLHKYSIPMHSQSKSLDKQLLYDLYINQKMPASRIGRKLNCGKTTVLNYLHKYDIPIWTTEQGKTIQLDFPFVPKGTKEKIKHIVSFSGGKDSTAMLLRMVELKMPIDQIINVDCGSWDWPATHRHINKLQKYMGRRIIRLKPEKSFDWWMFKAKSGENVNPGYGFPAPNYRWCTTIKVKTINKHLKKQGKCLQYIGIALDEAFRTKKQKPPENFRYPLIEWKWTERDCLNYCYSRGFDWEGLYKYTTRISCWCCPLQSLGTLKKLRKHFPKLWKRLLEMQKKSWNSFKQKKLGNLTVFDLEKRFAAEEKQLVLALNEKNEL